jgi:hypothetical protein
MIHEHNDTPAPEEPVLQPDEITITESNKAQLPEIDIPFGHVLVAALRPDGTEMAGSEFFYPEKTYQRFYGDPARFSVKKKL